MSTNCANRKVGSRTTYYVCGSSYYKFRKHRGKVSEFNFFDHTLIFKLIMWYYAFIEEFFVQ